MELDEDERARIGKEIIMLSGVCPACNGKGFDGDPPDANGVGGGQLHDLTAGLGAIFKESKDGMATD